jgi:hypothetical protein
VATLLSHEGSSARVLPLTLTKANSCFDWGKTVEREGRNPLEATFGGFPMDRRDKGFILAYLRLDLAWHGPANRRTEVVERLLADVCELCGKDGPLQAHHIRKLRDINRPGRKPKAIWEQVMVARRRKTLMVCLECHVQIHTGRYDGPGLRDSLESRVQ